MIDAFGNEHIETRDINQTALNDIIENRLVYRGLVGKKGYGLFAKIAFRPNDLICSFRGRIIRKLLNPDNTHTMTWDRDHIIAADKETLGGHLINYSCNPNSEGIRCLQFGCGIYRAIKPIKINEEITCHYEGINFECLCGDVYCSFAI